MQAADIDVLALLDTWWRFEHGWAPTVGYPPECPSTRGWHASRQWDDRNGALDGDLEARTAERIGFLIDQIAEPWRNALYLLARNRATGVSVWVSPRLPADDVLRARIVAEAVERLAEML